MPKVSIIVPVYNVENYLSGCIESMLGQTFTDFEIILIDDGSPDNSGKVCDEYALKDKRIKVIHKINEGVSIARNTGLEIAQGDYIMFVDSDDSVEKDILKDFCRQIEEYDVDLVIGGHKMINGDEETYFSNKTNQKMTVRQFYSEVNVSYPLINICGPWCKLYKRSIIKDYSVKFPKKLNHGEDTIFNLSYCEHVKDVYLNKDIYYIYNRENENSLCAKYREDLYESYKRIYDTWREFLKKIDASEDELENFENLYFNMMIGAIHYVYRNKKDKQLRKEIVKKVIKNEWIAKRRGKKIMGRFTQKIVKFAIIHKMQGIVRLIFSLKYRKVS